MIENKSHRRNFYQKKTLTRQKYNILHAWKNSKCVEHVYSEKSELNNITYWMITRQWNWCSTHRKWMNDILLEIPLDMRIIYAEIKLN